MPRTKSKDQLRAAELLRNQQFLTPSEALQLARSLKAEQQFGSARRMLAATWNATPRDDEKWIELTRQYALCTYKDVDLSPAKRYDQALEILGTLGDLSTLSDAEAMGLAGAIFKGKWEWFNQKSDLERSLGYYLRGARSPGDEGGYAAINAAFILDLLATEEAQEAQKSGAVSESAERRRQLSRQLREDLDRRFAADSSAGTLAKNWWVLVTWAEACFGLQQYQRAATLLDQARKLPVVAPWEMQSAMHQLVALTETQVAFASDQKGLRTEAQSALTALLAGFPGAAENAAIGKVGLGLSGGGFRASLFHIGVLARLAECDLLRHVDVISCVSGGSILGVHYYLEVRKLLQTKSDTEITREDYVAIVHRMETEFLRGVQKNLRMRAFFSLTHNLLAAVDAQHTITDYIGDLYEKELYGRVLDGEGGQPRYLSGLFVRPKGEAADYQPRRDNWCRRHKVPMLVLNATALNTGHNWQFTASWMGEPPSGIDAEVDANYRLRRMYYDSEELGAQYKRFRLGRAVAASACVPGLFDPITLKNLYPGITVQLVDGGVHDNQGVTSLLDEGCNVLIISDASGQMGSEDNPSTGLLAVPLRSNSILQARVREAEFEDLASRRQSLLLRGLVFLHLKKDLEVEAKAWLEDREPGEPQSGGPPHAKLTEYGIDRDLQRKLAAIRTDLDSFNDVEAYALMYSGYRMATHYLAELKIADDTMTFRGWKFLRITQPMTGEGGPAYQRVSKLLGAAGELLFKVWQVATAASSVTTALLLGGVGILAWLFGFEFHLEYLSAGVAGLVRGLVTGRVSVWSVLAAAFVVSLAAKSARVRRVLMALVMLPGSVIGWLHLHLYDQLYIRAGSIEQVPNPPTPPLGFKPQSFDPAGGRAPDSEGQCVSSKVPAAQLPAPPITSKTRPPAAAPVPMPKSVPPSESPGGRVEPEGFETLSTLESASVEVASEAADDTGSYMPDQILPETHAAPPAAPPLTTAPPVPRPLSKGPAPAPEKVQFTVGYPGAVTVEQWYTLSVWIHLASRAEQVRRLLKGRAPEFGAEPASAEAPSRRPLPRGTRLLLTPRIEGVRCNPESLELAWSEDIEEARFRILAAAEEAGRSLPGVVEISAAALPVAEPALSIHVRQPGETAEEGGMAIAGGQCFNRVFASYSHLDSDFVRFCTEFYKGMGIELYLDADKLLSGEDWEQRLRSFIADSDLFQLYWSENSRKSTEVEKEWRLAVQLLGEKGDRFLRPLYWQKPCPEIPPDLKRLHFAFVQFAGRVAPVR